MRRLETTCSSQGFLEAPLALDGAVHGLHLRIQTDHRGGAQFALLKSCENLAKSISVIGQEGGPDHPEVAVVLSGCQGHGPKRGQKIQQLGHPLGLVQLGQQFSMGGLGLIPDPTQAVEHDQAHGIPGFPQPAR